MKLDLALFVSSKRAAAQTVQSGGKLYDIVITTVTGENKEALHVAVFRLSTTQGGLQHRAETPHDMRVLSAVKERTDFMKSMGLSDEQWEPEEDARA